jgi:GR25 family glycosyltransferase involved in LPS biosynthesis
MNIILIIILFLLLFNIKKRDLVDLFTNTNNLNQKQHKIIYNVIHMKNSNQNKFNNILNMERQINKKLNIFDAVVGKNVDLTNLKQFDEKMTLNFNYDYIGEIGCYLSHFMLLKQAAADTVNDYTVIFEDDFQVNIDNLDEEINNIINKTNGDFDMLYIGCLNQNHGESIVDNIYYIDKNTQLLGTHGLLINNKSANKIVSNLININMPIDHKFNQVIRDNIISAKIIYPPIINQNQEDFNSEIRPVVWSKM